MRETGSGKDHELGLELRPKSTTNLRQSDAHEAVDNDKTAILKKKISEVTFYCNALLNESN